MKVAAVRKRELEAMQLAEHYREENRALKERIAQLEALIYVPSSFDTINKFGTVTIHSPGYCRCGEIEP